MRTLILLAAAAVVLVLPAVSFAYVGPGVGLGMFGALIGLVAGIVMSIGIIFLWPVRALIRKLRGKPGPEESGATAPPSPPPGDR